MESLFRTKLPKGFLAGGINSGIRLYRPDLGVIVLDKKAKAVGVFTKNKYKAAPVRYCMELLPADNIKAIITNSGQANAATGEIGVKHNKQIVETLAQELRCSPEQVLIASTGVIGQQMPIDKITAAIPRLTTSLSNIADKFALSILTTDLLPKSIHKKVKLSGGEITITGICKGSGMINPNMATMLGYFLTDVDLDLNLAQQLLKDSTDNSFNMISVDGDMSTNDCVFMLANGASGVNLSSKADIEIFKQALHEIAIILAKSIARDGEGATKLIEAKVNGLNDQTIAKELAKKIISSPLVKTAIYGQSPNWGRVLAKIGEVEIDEETLASCEIYIQGEKIFTQGLPVSYDLSNLKESMKEDTIGIDVTFSQGNENVIAWGCDLTEQYVDINAGYLS
ncbi:bifunctional glutamate N-acetyltransferase/amino-acid acetyltransferase ArgJ [Francisella adeliensis]|uniref:Arginine biosynthesis bifunctional protein ArgJ n=1 Tax=Francisella adeliensis TaxID=2007306 RepID=A0A2Z4Y024_9GAMM|nr:bifunctional glutamate N-acetyltransferase/amino-acid acetyltransferase ArgJ [Francisella adeliensis]AXA34497.1 bifunctional ornithine acetyltransferase/N-acetylglutamate synthase [Francisella adeliensis]MBK2086216.1 bifunctional glutamate N-acetyltransferase/amino-acid acetyltransferase ArgJ [Francisella adeliensis]MBK2096433.1 bifunctional glutamate N-acetyltransferase/amino-acid acetyltransferase ArgJ [Francisella adeliensis]QIW12744.1 bifunctional glutamate N-acetyltransferase/amino-acid